MEATAKQWLRRGRYIKQGSRAQQYLVSPDGEGCRALFTEDQTVSIDDALPEDDWTATCAASERPTLKHRNTRGSVKIECRDGKVQVWVGPKKDLIARLQAKKWRFNKTNARWWKKAGEDAALELSRNLAAEGFGVTYNGRRVEAPESVEDEVREHDNDGFTPPDAPTTPTAKPSTPEKPGEPAPAAEPSPPVANHVPAAPRISRQEWQKRQAAATREQKARNPTPHPSDDALAQGYGAAKNLDD